MKSYYHEATEPSLAHSSTNGYYMQALRIFLSRSYCLHSCLLFLFCFLELNHQLFPSVWFQIKRGCIFENCTLRMRDIHLFYSFTIMDKLWEHLGFCKFGQVQLHFPFPNVFSDMCRLLCSFNFILSLPPSPSPSQSRTALCDF